MQPHPKEHEMYTTWLPGFVSAINAHLNASNENAKLFNWYNQTVVPLFGRVAGDEAPAVNVENVENTQPIQVVEAKTVTVEETVAEIVKDVVQDALETAVSETMQESMESVTEGVEETIQEGFVAPVDINPMIQESVQESLRMSQEFQLFEVPGQLETNGDAVEAQIPLVEELVETVPPAKGSLHYS